ncbi:hypothetical protein [Chryseobacterium fistulae]|uniref:Uncharacterized protein n=1 Tax=Chryseobacterium fistulae TaxID=2675058 RepID=A0A6N4XT89_9FLAO|nr:hypothetical protein [Chryseobacterium fistulae]CAA7392645.1 hypothetical protein CHRY9393_03371 [Chryseobacterium fistulae]
MKRIILILFLSIISCSENKNQVPKCKITLTTENKNEIDLDENLKVDLIIDNNNLVFSLYNSGNKNIHFVPPKIIFEILEERKIDIDKNIVVKPYIKQIIVDKIYTSIIDDSKKKSIINIDSTMQRNYIFEPIDLAPKKMYIKEFELNCNKSDSGKYKILFFNKVFNNDPRITKINYPENLIVSITK